MNSRQLILKKIRHKRPSDDKAKDRVYARLTAKAANTIPKRCRQDPEALVTQFEEKLRAVQGTLETIDELSQIPSKVAAYLRTHNLPQAIKLAPDPELGTLDWAQEPMLKHTAGRAEETDRASLTIASKGLSETGTLVLCSSPKRPTTLNFLPEYHLVLLRRSDIVGGLEDSFDEVRKADSRSVNMISGPSRTGDIEQVLYLGAHGPRQLHVLLLND